MTPGQLGHEAWGRIEAVGADVLHFSVGDRVAFLSERAYAEYDTADESKVVALPDELIRKLKDLRTRRDELLQILDLERARLAQAASVLRKDMQRHITFLEQNVTAINQEFSRTVRFSAAWR